MKKLKVALPKGSLEKATYELLGRAGFSIVPASRSYYPSVDDEELEVVLYRPQEMPRYVEDGVVDCGLCGHDWVVENEANVVEVTELVYSKQTAKPIRWVVAVHEDSRFRSVTDLAGKKISTELVQVTKKYLSRHHVKAEVEFSWGATEVKPPLLADAIVEATETGSSLRANRLRVIDTVMTSTTRLIANKKSYKETWKRRKIDYIEILLKGAMAAQQKVGLKMNVAKKDLTKILSILPALKKPTISSLSNDGWHDVDTIIDKTVVREILPILKKSGAQGIIEYPLNKVIF